MVAKRILELNGVLAVNKPVGETSAKVVSQVKEAILSNLPARERKVIARRFKVGHGGTLDPMASGVLVIGLGAGCKALTGFLSGSKGYSATARFGRAFDTLDCTGMLLEERALPAGVDREQLQRVLDTRFTGDIMQRPPAFSALRINGERAYDLARKRQEQLKEAGGEADGATPAAVELPARQVHVDSIRITAWDLPEYTMDVCCGGGVYIRSLIADAALEVGGVAAMYALERTRQGQFGLADCIAVAECADLEHVTAALRHTQ